MNIFQAHREDTTPSLGEKCLTWTVQLVALVLVYHAADVIVPILAVVQGVYQRVGSAAGVNANAGAQGNRGKGELLVILEATGSLKVLEHVAATSFTADLLPGYVLLQQALHYVLRSCEELFQACEINVGNVAAVAIASIIG